MAPTFNALINYLLMKISYSAFDYFLKYIYLLMAIVFVYRYLLLSYLL